MTETSVPDDQKRRVVADFNAMAETYDTLRFVQVCARRLVERAALPPGAQVLDVATGTGWAACCGPARRPDRQGAGGIRPPSCWSVPGRKWLRQASPRSSFASVMQSGWTSETSPLMWCSVRPPSFSFPTCSRRCGSGTAC